jgi:hypothetical protein
LHFEPKNTKRFWRRTRTLSNSRSSRIQRFVNDIAASILTETNAMMHHAFAYYSTTFKGIEISLHSREVNEFKIALSEKLTELPSQSLLFQINDFIQSILDLKTKTSNGLETVFNKLLKLIPVSYYYCILQIFNQLLIVHILNAGNYRR